jgi:hypothetical protein
MKETLITIHLEIMVNILGMMAATMMVNGMIINFKVLVNMPGQVDITILENGHKIKDMGLDNYLILKEILYGLGNLQMVSLFLTIHY